MKKCFSLLSLLALGAAAASATTTILTFATTEPDFATDNWALNGVGNGASASWSGTDAAQLYNQTTLSAAMTAGKFWQRTPAVVEWANTAALGDMNNVLRTTMTATQIQSLTYVASGAQGSKSTLTFDFTANPELNAGSSIVFYVAAVASNQDQVVSYNNIAASGLDNCTIEYATAAGDGFQSGSFSIDSNNIAIFKISGDLTATEQVTLSSSVAKNGWAMVAFTPEPATATLSLLALAGMALRRRRK